MKDRIDDQVNVLDSRLIHSLLLCILHTKLQLVHQGLRENFNDIVHLAEKIIRPHHESIFFTDLFDTLKSDPMKLKIWLLKQLQNTWKQFRPLCLQKTTSHYCNDFNELLTQSLAAQILGIGE